MPACQKPIHRTINISPDSPARAKKGRKPNANGAHPDGGVDGAGRSPRGINPMSCLPRIDFQAYPNPLIDMPP
ncbi:MAG: hypothetical protein AB2569_09560 [Candidatus Thiodiazotropha endolucinida]